MAEAYKEPKHHYTYADVLKWDERVRAEIIDGIIYVDGQMVEDDSGFYEEPVMLAAPTRMHQECHRELFLKIGNFLVGKTCKVYSAPFGVRLFPQKDESDNNLVEPDITVVCDSSKLDDRGCNGAPDLIIEILSPSTASHDMLNKFQKYLEAGVREYWIVDPDKKTIHACVLQDRRYIVSVYRGSDAAPVTVLPGCEINLKEVFAG